MTRRLTGPLLILTVGFTFSLAANLIWTWPGGPIRVAGGALASLALPAAVHLWPQIPADGWWRRSQRAVVMTLIALMAAYTTFSHASALLIARGEVPLLAAFYPAMTELMVVMGVLAHRARPVPAIVADVVADEKKPRQSQGTAGSNAVSVAAPDPRSGRETPPSVPAGPHPIPTPPKRELSQTPAAIKQRKHRADKAAEKRKPRAVAA